MWRALLVLMMVGGVSAAAQNVTPSSKKPPVAATTNAVATPAVPTRVRKAEPTPPKTINTGRYGGLVTDLASTNKPLKVINMKAPLDPAVDRANLSTNPVTGRIIGVNLFSFKF